jgi:hypothetical protein
MSIEGDTFIKGQVFVKNADGSDVISSAGFFHPNTSGIYSWSVDPDTGLSWFGDDRVSIQTGGAARLVIANGQPTAGFAFVNTDIINELGEPMPASSYVTLDNGTVTITNRLETWDQILAGPPSFAAGYFFPIGTASAPSYSFSQDSDTGMYSAGGNQVGISTNGVSRMIVSNTGLAVAGTSSGTTIQAGSGSASSPSFAFTSDTTSGMFLTNVSGTALANGGQAMVLADKTSNMVDVRVMPGVNTSGTLRIGRYGGTGRFHEIEGYNSSTAAMNYLKFKVHNAVVGATTDVMTLDGQGYVGIGTTSPLAILHVLGSDASGSRVRAERTGGVPIVMASLNTVGIVATDNDSPLALWTSGTSRVHVTAAGDVGIGTTSPTQRLHVVGNIIATGSIDAGTSFYGRTGDSAGAPSFSFTGETTTGMYRSAANQIGFSIAGNQRVVISNTFLRYREDIAGLGPHIILENRGNADANAEATCRITTRFSDNGSTTFRSGGYIQWAKEGTYNGTTAQRDSQFQIFTARNGTDTLAADFTNIGNFTISGATATKAAGSGSTWANACDARVKGDIQDADTERCYQIVKTLPLRRFTFLTPNAADIRDKYQIGWIADEVAHVFPKAVTEEELYGFPDFKMLNDDQLYKCMWGALQETIKRAEDAEARLATTEARLATAEASLAGVLDRLAALEEKNNSVSGN